MLLLAFTMPHKSLSLEREAPLPEFISHNYQNFRSTFHSAQTANLAWMMMTGEKKRLTPTLKHDLQILELGFLLSPGGLYLGLILTLLFGLLRFVTRKRNERFIKITGLCLCLFLPYPAMNRMILFQFLVLIKNTFSLKVEIEIIFCLTFLISFFLGHYQLSPLGFLLSFLFWGTVLALRDYSRLTLLLGLLASHLLFSFFSDQRLSLLAVLLNLPLIACYSLILLLGWATFAISYLGKNIGCEYFIKLFIFFLHIEAKIGLIAMIDSSAFLLLAVWLILFQKNKKWILVCLLLHSNCANSPAIYYSGSYSKELERSEHKSF